MAARSSGASGKSSAVLAAAVVLLLTLVGAGLGLVAGSLSRDSSQVAGEAVNAPKAGADSLPSTAENEASHQAPSHADPAGNMPLPELPEPDSVTVKAFPFPPVLTTLAEPRGTWIRLEGSMLIDADAERNPELLAEQAATNLLGYLRSVKLDDIDGPSGLLFFRQDLNDVVSALSDGQVREVLIHTLVVE